LSFAARARSIARNWFRRVELDRDLDAEVNAYLDLLTEEKIAAGMSPRAALRAARIEMGGIEHVKSQVRDSRAGALAETVAQDIRYGARGLRRNPGLTAIVVAILALGIGANGAVFALLDALLLRPITTVDPERVVVLFTGDYGGHPKPFATRSEFDQLRARSDAVVELVAHVPTPFSLGADRTTAGAVESEVVLGELASGNMFTVLGIEPDAGRSFLPEEDRAGGTHPVAVISHRLWQRRFGGDPSLVGRAVRLNGHPFTIVGVAPEDFRGTIRGAVTDVWVPLTMQAQVAPSKSVFDPLASRPLLLMGRLRPGVTVGAAQKVLDHIAAELQEQHPETWSDARARARPLTLASEGGGDLFLFGRDAVDGLVLLLAVVGVVLLLACANVSGLLLTRASARRKEFTVRVALGAGRVRLIRQLMTESLLLSIASGAAGLIVGRLGADLLSRVAAPIRLDLDLGLDARVIAFICGITLATTLLIGLIPALSASRPDLQSALKDDASAAGAWPRRGRMRSAMIVVQLALSLVLLIAAGLLLRSLASARTARLGFEPDNLVAATVDLSLEGYSRAETEAFGRRWLERVRALPGVSGACLAARLPLGGGIGPWNYTVEGSRAPASDGPAVLTTAVSPGYFDVMRIRLLRGRAFDDGDLRRGGERLVVVVNQSFARAHWPGEDPIGKRLQIGTGPSLEPPYLTVVGLVEDGKYDSLEEARPFVYVPLWQHFHWDFSLVVRAPGDPSGWLSAVRREAHRLDENVALTDERGVTDNLKLALLPLRLLGAILAALGLLVLAIAALGLYGLMSYSVAQRTREIGIRRALGARERDVVRLVVGHCMRLTAIGLTIGLAAAAVIAHRLSDLLYAVSPIDPLTFVASPLLLTAVALLASYLPARRGARLEPMSALHRQ